MDVQDLPDFGREAENLQFDGFWDWFVSYTDVSIMWRASPTYVMAGMIFLVGGLVTLFHALIHGSRFVHLWVGILLHGLVVEMVCYYLPDIDNFWHSQTPIMLLGRRLPLHILFLYPVFIYNASMAVRKLRLPVWSEPFAVGLISVLIDIPYDIMSVRFLHWTWHDTDPNIFDRHYHVPWNSYYFHASFAASFTFWFHGTRRLLAKTTDKWTASKSFFKESLCTILAGILGMPGGILLFLPIYHPLHDIYNVHSEVTFFMLFATFLVLAWSGEKSRVISKVASKKNADYMLLAFLFIHYSLYLGMALIGDPATEVSIGFHEPIGPCDERVSIKTALGLTLSKRKYLCIEDNDETYFGWTCLPGGKPPKNGSYWYTACGTPLKNRAEYITVLLTICIVAFGVFTNAFFRVDDNRDDSASTRGRNLKKVKDN